MNPLRPAFKIAGTSPSALALQPVFERGPKGSAGGVIQQHHLRIGATALADRLIPLPPIFACERFSMQRRSMRFQSFEGGKAGLFQFCWRSGQLASVLYC